MVTGFGGAQNISENPARRHIGKGGARWLGRVYSKVGFTMTFQDGTENELRQQLREAWQKISELEWRLQAERRNSKTQDLRLAAQRAELTESRDEHEQAMADRDQDFADLEDEHQETTAAFESYRKRRGHPTEGAPRSAHEEVRAPGEDPVSQLHRVEISAELQDWLRVNITDEPSSRGPGALQLEVLVTRASRKKETASAVTYGVNADYALAIPARLAIICAWVIDGWLAHTCRTGSEDSPSAVTAQIRLRENPPEIQVWLPFPAQSAAVKRQQWREQLQPCVATLGGYVHDAAELGITVAFPIAPLS